MKLVPSRREGDGSVLRTMNHVDRLEVVGESKEASAMEDR
jgi:hypothetical protein